jgi:protein SCO1/2
MGSLALVILLGLCERGAAQTALPPILRDIGIDQRLGEQVPLDLKFVDETGRPVVLGDYFGEKPVILVLAYYRCPMLCTQVLNGLVEGLREIPWTIGKEFRVVTVSFDPDETSQLAAAKKRTYVRTYAKADVTDGWRFLTGKQEAITRLTHAVGFRYAYDARSNQFAHAAGIAVLTPSGKISRYFFDVHYDAKGLMEGLREAAHNRSGSAIAQILLFCFHYDPAAGKYGVVIMRLIRVGGVLTVLGLGVFFVWLFRQDAARVPPGIEPAGTVAQNGVRVD